jgi:hypothetical protein
MLNNIMTNKKKHKRFEAFTATKFNEILLGFQPCQVVKGDKTDVSRTISVLILRETDLCTVHTVPHMFGKENGCQKPENTAACQPSAAHSKNTSKLRNVQVEFLPDNTSVLQKMDKG